MSGLNSCSVKGGWQPNLILHGPGLQLVQIPTVPLMVLELCWFNSICGFYDWVDGTSCGSFTWDVGL